MDELAKRFSDLAAQYGPKVVDAALNAARIEAYSTMAASAVAFVFAIGGFIGGRALWTKWHKEGWDDVTAIPFFIIMMVSTVATTVAIWTFIDPWTWTAINHPELWIAKKAFRL